jgi:hypothetical protein
VVKIKGWEKELEDINPPQENTENKQDKQTQKSDSIGMLYQYQLFYFVW